MLTGVVRYRHWKNHAAGGDCAFVTTKCLDFAHCFQTPLQRDLLASTLLRECMHYGIYLHAYVVMSNHIHLLLQVPEGRTVGWCMSRLKARSSRALLPTLAEGQMQRLKVQQGLDRRLMWERSFRSVIVRSQAVWEQKVAYIEQNPVRASVVEEAAAYRWSSLWAVSQGAVTEHGDLDLLRTAELYEKASLDKPIDDASTRKCGG
jgi:putative transposase